MSRRDSCSPRSIRRLYQAQYDQAVAKKAQDEAQLANARLDLERYTRLAATNAINKQQLDTQKALVNQLEALVKLDQAAIDNVRAILSYTDVIAPIAGRTGIRLVDEGNIVKASDATGLVVITQVRPISVFFSLPQQDLPELNKGLAEGPLPVDAFGADGKGALDKGKVLVIDNQVDQTTGTVKVKAEFPNANLQLWPGQFVNVRVLIDTLRQVVVVPTAAVQRGPNGTFVYVVKDDNTVTVRRVTLTQQDDVRAVVAHRPAGGRPRGHDRLRPPHRGDAGDGVERRGRRAGRARPAAAGRNPRQARARRRSAIRARAGHRSATHERVLTLHPAPDRDLAARGGGDAGRLARLSGGCRSRRCRRSIFPPSRSPPSFPAPART